MNRIKLLVVALVASGALLVSTGAVPLSGDGDTPGGDVVLAPADGPNGAYAMMNDEGKLELVLGEGNPNTDIEGVPPGVQTPIDEVFTVTYTGDQFAEVWFEDGAEDVRFYRGDDPSETLEGAANAVVLRPNETVAIGLFVDTRGDHDVAAASSFTVEVREGPPVTSAPTTTRVTTTTDRPATTATTTTTTTTSDRPATTTDRPTPTDRPATTATTTTSDRPTTTTTTTNRPTTTDRPGATPDRSPTPQSTTTPAESDPPATETPTPPETDSGVGTPTSEPPTPTPGRTTTDTDVTDRQGPATATAQDSPTAGPPPAEGDTGGQTGPIEAGGPVPTALLGIVVLVLVVLSALAIYRYRG